MSATIITIDIATQLQAGIASAVSTVSQTSAADPGDVRSVTVLAKGVKSDATKRGDETTFPAVAIMVAEAMNHEGAQASKLRNYPVTIRAATQYQDDPWQITFYTLAQAVGQYLLAPPTLTLNLTSCKFNALSVMEQPTVTETEGRAQVMQWNVIVRVQIT
jgi:hypothetical protein